MTNPFFSALHPSEAAGTQGSAAFTNSTIIIDLSNDSVTVPSSTDGLTTNFSSAVTTVSILEGLTNVTNLWSITATPGTGVTVSFTSNTYTVGTMSTDSGTVTFTATRAGYATLTAVFTIAKARAGSPGSSVTVYEIRASQGIIKKNSAGTFTPATITFEGLSITGAGAPAPYSGRFIIDASTDNGATYSPVYTSSTDQPSYTYTLSGTTVTHIRATLYAAGGTSVILDQEVFPVASDGINAVSGFLTNEAHTVPASSAGVVVTADLNIAGGTFKVFNGTTDVTTTNTTFSIVGGTDGGVNWTQSKNGLTLTLVKATGVYSLTQSTWTTSDSETFTLQALHAGVTINLVYTISKSKAGVTGAQGPSLQLTASAQAFTFTDSVANPTSQTITLTATLQNLTGTPTWTATPSVTLGGLSTDLIRTLTVANFGTNRQVTIGVTVAGVTDRITIVRLERNIVINSANRVQNSLFETGTNSADWGSFGESGVTANPATSSTVGGFAAAVSTGSTPNNTARLIFSSNRKFPVTAGETLFVGVGANTGANTLVTAQVLFQNASGTYITELNASQVAASTNGRSTGFITVPAGATQGTFRIQITHATSGAVTATIYQPMVTSAAADQTLLPAFTRGLNAQDAANNTFLDGSGTLQGVSSGAGTAVANSRISINANGSLTGAGAGSVTLPGLGQSFFRVSAIGNSATSNGGLGTGLYVNGSTTAFTTGGRSYTVVKILRSTGVPTLIGTYDVFGSTANATAMATALNAIGSDSIVVVFTADEPQTNRLFGTLPAALYRHGASRTIFGSSDFRFRSAYVLIGIGACGEGNGAEIYQGATDNDVNAWVDAGFSITNSVLTGVSASATPTTLSDYGYTGALDANNTSVDANGAIQGVSSGAGTTIANNQIAIVSNSLTGIGAGNNTEVANSVAEARQGRFQWQTDQYRTNVAINPTGTVPNYDLVNQATLIKRLFVPNTTTSFTFSDDNYFGVASASVYSPSAWTWSLTVSHDDAGRIYVNGQSIYSNQIGTYAISISFPAGWSTIELMWAEQGGGDAFNLFQAISARAEITDMWAGTNLVGLISSAATTANMLTSNVVVNSEFTRGIYGFRFATTTGAGTPYTVNGGVNLNAAYSGLKNVMWASVATGGANWASGGYADAFSINGNWNGGNMTEQRQFGLPVKNGDRVYARCLLARHRCNAQLLLLVFDKDGNYLGSTSTSFTGGRVGGAGGGLPTNFDVVGGTHLITDVNAASALMVWRMLATGEADPYIFMTEPAMGILPSYQTTLPPYQLGNTDPLADATSLNTSANSNALGGTAAATVASNITTAQTTANSKNRTFTGTATPVGPQTGDLWSIPGEQRLRRWSGTAWVVQLEFIANARTSFTVALPTTSSFAQLGAGTLGVGPNGTTQVSSSITYSPQTGGSGPRSGAIELTVDWRPVPGTGAWTQIGASQTGSLATRADDLAPGEPGDITIGSVTIVRTLAGPVSVSNNEFRVTGRLTGNALQGTPDNAIISWVP